LHSPPGKFSVRQTLAQLLLLTHRPLKWWLCDRQCLASATVAGPISATTKEEGEVN